MTCAPGPLRCRLVTKATRARDALAPTNWPQTFAQQRSAPAPCCSTPMLPPRARQIERNQSRNLQSADHSKGLSASACCTQQIQLKQLAGKATLHFRNLSSANHSEGLSTGACGTQQIQPKQLAGKATLHFRNLSSPNHSEGLSTGACGTQQIQPKQLVRKRRSLQEALVRKPQRGALHQRGPKAAGVVHAGPQCADAAKRGACKGGTGSSGKVWGGAGSSGELCQHCAWRPAGKQASSPRLGNTLEARWSGCATTAQETYGLASQRHMLGV